MMTAVIIGVAFSAIDVLVMALICFGVNHSALSTEVKEDFNNKIFGSGPRYRINLIITFVLANFLIEFLAFNAVFYYGPSSWRETKFEDKNLYYSGMNFEVTPLMTIVIEENDKGEEKQYIIVEREEKIKATDKAPFSTLWKALKIEVSTGRVEYRISSVY